MILEYSFLLPLVQKSIKIDQEMRVIVKNKVASLYILCISLAKIASELICVKYIRIPLFFIFYISQEV